MADDAVEFVLPTLTKAFGESTLETMRAALAASPLRVVPLLAYLAGAARRTRGERLVLANEDREALQRAGLWVGESATAAFALRVLSLLEACRRLSPSEQRTLIKKGYQTSGNEERVALLRTLPLLPAPERFLPIAEEACRTNVVDVFEAIACHNPYPRRYFGELAFNQLVVKAMFLGVAVAPIEGLAERNNEELRRMVRDFAAERRAAGRPVPKDAVLVDPELELEA